MRLVLLLAALAVSGCSLVGGEAEIRALVTLPAEAAGLDVTVEVDGRALPLSPSPTTAGPAVVAKPRANGTGAVAVSCAVSVALDPVLGLPADARLWLFATGEPEDGTVLYGPTSG